MVFSSVTFLFLFLPVVLFLYYLSPKRLKNPLLMLSGFFFYAWGEPIYILLMFFTTLSDYTLGRLIHKNAGRRGRQKFFMILSLVIDLSLLGVFKYASLAVNGINALFGLSLPDPNLPLPVGISFYTFQSLSYIIDLYRGDTTVQKSYIDYAAYVSMFPQLVAGPIVRYEDIASELRERKITLEGLSSGVFLFSVGLAKKMLLANNVGLLWTRVKAMDGATPALTAWLGILAFTFQIYFDFSGYSDMACGMGKMLGFTFPKNFDYPYMAKSVTDFWRRWHITLSSWFKNYVYIPLGGNRKGIPRQIVNLLIVWGLTGLWHGASVNFLLWGLYYGVLLIIEKFLLKRFIDRLPGWAARIYAFLTAVFGWVLFEEGSFGAIGRFFGSLFGSGGFADEGSLYLLGSFGLLLVVCFVASNNWVSRACAKAAAKCPGAAAVWTPVCVAAFLILSTAFLVNSTYNPFIYYRF